MTRLNNGTAIRPVPKPLALVLAVLLLVLTSILLFNVKPAQAVPYGASATLTCGEATVDLEEFDANATVTITIDGIVDVLASVFGGNYSNTWTLDPGVDHTLVVFVDSLDGNGTEFDFTFSDATSGCGLIAAASISILDATCDDGEVLVYGLIENATFSGTANNTEGPGSYLVTATATSPAIFNPDDGVNPAGTEKEFSGTLAGPLDPNSPTCQGPQPPDIVTTEDGDPTWVCVPGILQAAEISFVRDTFAQQATWNTTTHTWEYGAPVLTSSQTITIPTPPSFSAPCPVTVLPDPPGVTVTDPTCDADGTLVTPAAVANTTFAFNRAFDGPGSYTGTYTADSGYAFAGGPTVSYTVTVLPETTVGCAVLALTGNTGLAAWIGANQLPLIGGVLGLIAIGAGLVVFVSRRKVAADNKEWVQQGVS